MNRFTSRQVVVLCAISMSVGAVLSPPSSSLAQPSEPSVVAEAGTAQTPQPLATPPASSGASLSFKGTRAIGTITGQGTSGNISKFTGTNAIGNSALFENAGKVGIGTTTPTGLFSATNTTGIGVYGIHSGSGTGADQPGVQGDTTSTIANAIGVKGVVNTSAPGAQSAGVRGINNGTNNNGFGVYGSHAGGGLGIYGFSRAGSGVLGDSNTGAGVRGRHSLTTGDAPGVNGETNSTSANATGVQGVVNSTSPGSTSAGVRGINNGTNIYGFGVYGSHAGYGAGVYGTSTNGNGVSGLSSANSGVSGSSTSSNGVYGTSTNGNGVYGYSSSAYNSGVRGYAVSSYGVYGSSSSSSDGVYGTSDSGNGTHGYSSSGNGVYGYSSSSHGVYGYSVTGIGVRGYSPNGFAGYFDGNVHVTGTLSKAAGSFKIDHPQHPATEYLSHSFVESPDMMNVYNGNAKLNSRGEAVVTLPSYFQSLNRDFRYQLTCVGAPALIYVAQEIHGNHFKIAGGKAGMKVSWQVTGIRNDAYARHHRIHVEETKTGADRGKYLYPAGFGAGKDKQIGSQSRRIASR